MSFYGTACQKEHRALCFVAKECFMKTIKKTTFFALVSALIFASFAVSCKKTAADKITQKQPDYLVLVNKTHPISGDYAKSLDLVTVDTVYEDETAEVEKSTYEAYLSLKAALAEQGIEIGIDSAYRSVEYQEKIMREFTEKYGEEYAKNTVAVPGTSEHHTGLAIDIVPKVDGEWKWENEDMMKLPELFALIHKELPKHGFILRLLPGKEEITGYSYEPWHIRYVGSAELAQKITDSGLVLEEYVDGQKDSAPKGFAYLAEVVPDAILEIRYYSTYNFVGDRIDGYEKPVALLTEEAAEALKAVSDDVKAQGYRLKIYDAYRPQRAVTHFMNWAKDTSDTRMKQYFYPNLDKSVLFAQGYIAEKSGHSRGSTVDLTLFDMASEKELDMGGTFDWFGEESHPDYRQITEEQFANRMILREAMLRHGFKPLEEEWWHFTLKDEPYSETYFDYPVR